MAKIRLLPDHLINQIAAGEVVERPASVVRELVENALDAGATRIRVEIAGGGSDLCEISDNGSGMTREDALMAFERHATSKIATAEDLQAIHTLGFRGEALPSIASVCKLTCITRTAGEDAATVIRFEHGILRDAAPKSGPVGTTLRIEQLFGNLPARRKFLKSPQTEQGHILATMTDFALLFPDVGFLLVVNGRNSLDFPEGQTRTQRLQAILSDQDWDNLLTLRSEETPIILEGYLGTNAAARTNRNALSIYVNRRRIQSRLISGAIAKGYAEVLPRGQYPLAYLFLEIDPREVDVNVHPQKAEVRFRQEDLIFRRVSSAIRERLGRDDASPVRSFGQPSEPTAGIDAERAVGDFLKHQRTAAADHPRPIAPVTSSKPLPASTEVAHLRSRVDRVPFQGDLLISAPPPHVGDPPPIREREAPLFVQMHSRYILCETRGAILLMDQHAAHERVLFEEIRAQLTGEAGVSQQLLLPVPLALTPVQWNLWQDFEGELERIGYHARELSGRTLLVEGVPASGRAGHPELLPLLLDELAEVQGRSDDRVRNLAASFACRAAIKFGQSLSTEEMAALFDQLFSCADPYACPHGRPTVIRLTLEELSRKFGREG